MTLKLFRVSLFGACPSVAYIRIRMYSHLRDRCNAPNTVAAICSLHSDVHVCASIGAGKHKLMQVSGEFHYIAGT